MGSSRRRRHRGRRHRGAGPAPPADGVENHMSFHPNDIARRGRGASILLCCALGFLLSAFFKYQVLHNEEWSQQSAEQHYRRLPIPAPRGAILDRTGAIIAGNVVAYSVSFLATS